MQDIPTSQTHMMHAQTHTHTYMYMHTNSDTVFVMAVITITFMYHCHVVQSVQNIRDAEHACCRCHVRRSPSTATASAEVLHITHGCLRGKRGVEKKMETPIVTLK